MSIDRHDVQVRMFDTKSNSILSTVRNRNKRIHKSTVRLHKQNEKSEQKQSSGFVRPSTSTGIRYIKPGFSILINKDIIIQTANKRTYISSRLNRKPEPSTKKSIEVVTNKDDSLVAVKYQYPYVKTPSMGSSVKPKHIQIKPGDTDIERHLPFGRGSFSSSNWFL